MCLTLYRFSGHPNTDKLTNNKISEIKRTYDLINVPLLKTMISQHISKEVPFFDVYDIYTSDGKLDISTIEKTLTSYFQRRLGNTLCYVEIPKYAVNLSTIELHFPI